MPRCLNTSRSSTHVALKSGAFPCCQNRHQLSYLPRPQPLERLIGAVLKTLAGLCRRPRLGREWHEACLGRGQFSDIPMNLCGNRLYVSGCSRHPPGAEPKGLCPHLVLRVLRANFWNLSQR